MEKRSPLEVLLIISTIYWMIKKQFCIWDESIKYLACLLHASANHQDSHFLPVRVNIAQTKGIDIKPSQQMSPAMR